MLASVRKRSSRKLSRPIEPAAGTSTNGSMPVLSRRSAEFLSRVDNARHTQGGEDAEQQSTHGPQHEVEHDVRRDRGYAGPWLEVLELISRVGPSSRRFAPAGWPTSDSAEPSGVDWEPQRRRVGARRSAIALRHSLLPDRVDVVTERLGHVRRRILRDFRVVSGRLDGQDRAGSNRPGLEGDILGDIVVALNRSIVAGSLKMVAYPTAIVASCSGARPGEDSTSSGLPHIRRMRMQRRQRRRKHGEHSDHQNHPPPSPDLLDAALTYRTQFSSK